MSTLHRALPARPRAAAPAQDRPLAGRGVYAVRMARPPARPPRRRLATLLAALLVLAGMWLAGGLAAAAGWPRLARWLAAALVWPIVPLLLLILVHPRLGLHRVALVLTVLGTGVCALTWRAGLVAAVTEHAAWMLPPAPADPPAIATPTPRQPVAPDPPPPNRPTTEPPTHDPPAPHQPGKDQPTTVKPPRPDSPPPPLAAGARSRCFREVVRTDHSDHAYTTTLVDMDGDRQPDAVAIDAGDAPAIRVWKGDRAGRFHPASSLAYAGGGLHFAVLDLDRDGTQDLATSDHDEATVSLWLGAGDGTLTRGASLKTYRDPLGIGSADLDLDGAPDLFIAHYFHVEVLRGDRGGKLRTTPWLRLVKQPGDPGRLLTPEDIVAADLTGDGRPELVIPKGDVTSIEVWTGDPRAGMRRVAAVTSCYAPADTLVGDVIEDGAPDVLVRCGEGRVELLAGDGKGGLERRGFIGPEHTLAAGALVDLTGDGHLDLVVTTIPGGFADGGIAPADGALRVYAGDGEGHFRDADTLPLAGFQHRVVAVLDIDDDHHLDVVHECFGQSPGGHLGVAFGTGCVAAEAAP